MNISSRHATACVGLSVGARWDPFFRRIMPVPCRGPQPGRQVIEAMPIIVTKMGRACRLSDQPAVSPSFIWPAALRCRRRRCLSAPVMANDRPQVGQHPVTLFVTGDGGVTLFVTGFVEGLGAGRFAGHASRLQCLVVQSLQTGLSIGARNSSNGDYGKRFPSPQKYPRAGFAAGPRYSCRSQYSTRPIPPLLLWLYSPGP